jgi:hypothetical protein
MKKLLFLLIFGLTMHLGATAQSDPNQLSLKESKKSKSQKNYAQKDRSYWQKERNVRQYGKSAKKKKCDCPGQMTEKQRRKFRYKS